MIRERMKFGLTFALQRITPHPTTQLTNKQPFDKRLALSYVKRDQRKNCVHEREKRGKQIVDLGNAYPYE